MPESSLHCHVPTVLHNTWDNSLSPIVEVASGTVLELDVADASGGQITQRSNASAIANLDFAQVNPVTGPIYINGAKPGDVLEVEVMALEAASWGWTAIIPGFGLLADDFPESWLTIADVSSPARTVSFLNELTLPLRPFPGTIGVAPPTPGAFSLIPPTKWGGNLDIKHLVVGSRLMLPIGVEGALLSVGDAHAAQGDGEVCGTAVETTMRASLRVSVRRDVGIQCPQYFTPHDDSDRSSGTGHHVCTGVGPDLLDASRDAVRGMIDYIIRHLMLAPEEAYALVSVACDLRIHEIVDAPNWVVGCSLPTALLGTRRDSR